MKILFLEDDPIIKDIVLESLFEQNYEVDYAFSIDEAIKYLDSKKYELFLFDVNVPDGDGFSFLSDLRENGDTTPAIFITARNDLQDMKLGFASGCDDYIKKPFMLDELELRINNIKRIYQIDSSFEICEGVVLNIQTQSIVIEGISKTIREKEMQVLEYLAKNHHKNISHDELVQNIWSYDEFPSDSTVRTYIKNIRSLIGSEKIQTIKGVGYRFIKE
ncbi:MAG TPA: response regulator transcription factor [Arcobacter sp.]|jgi:DNA-binding response OmpR family regulator|nr:response regulator transcription factor [Arcobacter sp.]